MNPTDPQLPWLRLTTAARTVRDERDAAAPYGFATRIAALALAQEPKVVSLIERLALRAVGVACLLALTSLAINYSSFSSHGLVVIDDGLDSLNDDTVALVLNLTD